MAQPSETKGQNTFVASLLSAFTADQPAKPNHPVEHLFSSDATPWVQEEPSSSGLLPSDPIIGDAKARKTKSKSKAAKKAWMTKGAALENARELEEKQVAVEEKRRAEERTEEKRQQDRQRMRMFSEVISTFTRSSTQTLGDFLCYVFGSGSEASAPLHEGTYAPKGATPGGPDNPGDTNQHPLSLRHFRWNQFYRGNYMIELLNLWASGNTPLSIRKALDDWALNRIFEIVQSEAKVVTHSETLWARNQDIDKDFVLGYDLRVLNKELEVMAPVSLKVLGRICTSSRQEKGGLSKRAVERKIKVCTSSYISLLGEYSQTNSRHRQILGLYLYTTGAQRQCISVLSHLGLSCGYTSLSRIRANLGAQKFVAEGRSAEAEVEGSQGRPKDAPSALQPFPQPYTSQPSSEMESDITIVHPTSISEPLTATDDRPTRHAPNSNEPPKPSNSQLATGKSAEGRKPGLLQRLSDSCRNVAREVAKTNLFTSIYDNINIMDKVAEQIVGRKDAQENGTCATIVELHNATQDALLASTTADSFKNAPNLALKDIELTPEEHREWEGYLLHTILRIVVMQGGPKLERFRRQVEEDQPISNHKIALHKSRIHPLPSMNIDESTITGNAEVVEAIFRELALPIRTSEFLKYTRLVAGDQLSISRLRSIVKNRAGHEGGFNSFSTIVTIPGLFHLKMAATQGVLETFFGKPNCGGRNPGSLWYHNTILDRKPIVLTSLPPFRTTRDLIFHSLYARVLHCLQLVSPKKDGAVPGLEEVGSTIKTYFELKERCRTLLKQYTDANHVAKLREERSQKPNSASGDMVFENAVLFLRDAFILRELTDTIKSGDSGRVVLSIKVLALAFRGNGRTKYAHEVLFLIHNLTHVWPSRLRNLILDNWLVNTTGNPNSWVELDLLQEHMNFWIKKVYLAHGSNASWDWLATISPCIDILRQLATRMHSTLGSDQGVLHTPPDITRDLNTLIASLQDHQVYTTVPGRTLDSDDKPATDVITAGVTSLIHGGRTSPLKQYNTAFNLLRQRMAVPVLVGATPLAVALACSSSIGTSVPSHSGQNATREAIPATTATGHTGDQDSDEDSESENEELMADIDKTLSDDEDELGLEDGGDVALDMDTEEGFASDEEFENEPY